MLPPEIARQIRLLDIRTNRLVDELLGGAYRSAFRGRGMEFDEVREYTPEDDVRDIDWNVSARMGSPYIKKYVEERELTQLLLVDVSASGAFGRAGKTKRHTAAELAAILAFSAARNGDKVGLLMFSDRIELYVPLRSGRSHTLRLIREMLAFTPQGRGTDLNTVLAEAERLLKKRSVIFLLSDLIDEHAFEDSLSRLNRRHDVIAVAIYDPLERIWPSGLPVEVEDAETGNFQFFPGGRRAGRELNQGLAAAAESSRSICRRARVDLIEIESGADVVKPVCEFFAGRRLKPAGFNPKRDGHLAK